MFGPETRDGCEESLVVLFSDPRLPDKCCYILSHFALEIEVIRAKLEQSLPGLRVFEFNLQKGELLDCLDWKRDLESIGQHKTVSQVFLFDSRNFMFREIRDSLEQEPRGFLADESVRSLLRKWRQK